jgi:hypothetical protein
MSQGRRPWLAALAVIILALLALAGGLFLVGRWGGQGRYVDADQPITGAAASAPVSPASPVGQTFVARHGGLAGIEFYLQPSVDAPQTLTLHLRTGPASPDDLVTTALQLTPDAAPGFYRFAFPPLPDSHGQYYYAFLSASSSTESVSSAQPIASVPLATGSAYLDGAAYQAHEPLDAQTGFRLVHSPPYMAQDLLKASLTWVGLLALTMLLFVVPGWAILALLGPQRRLAWTARLGLAVGASLAIYPVLILWTSLLGLRLGALYAILPVVVGLVVLVWCYRDWRPRWGWRALHAWARSDSLWPDLALLAVLALVFGVRLLVIRSLDAPLWGDGYQHTMITQLLVDNGGLFHSWAPYAELERFSYHFGFHSAAALLQWLTRSMAAEATLWAGQLLNGLAVLAVYPLGLRVSGSRWGGVWAVLLAGLLSPMPMYHLNWGRYTQLAGLVILPAAAWLTWEVVQAPERLRRLVALVALVVGGLALTHYRVLIFYAVFSVALLLIYLNRTSWRETLLRLAAAGAGAVLVFLPWLISTAGADFARVFGLQLTTTAANTHPVAQAANAIGSLDTFLAPVLWLASILGLGVGLWRRQRGALLIGLWWLLLLIATNPEWLSLPGTGAISNFAVFISSYLPAGLLSAVLAVHLTRPVVSKRWSSALLALLFVVLGLWGTRLRMGDLNTAKHALLTRPDVQAGAWIADNTAEESRFLVNSFFAYGGYAVVGSDGGWWLPLSSARLNTVPPLNYGGELVPGSSDRQAIEDLARQAQAKSPDDPQLLDLLRQRGITHVYVGQRQGRVNYAGDQVLDPEQLRDSPNYRLVYHQDRVWVFEVAREE